MRKFVASLLLASSFVTPSLASAPDPRPQAQDSAPFSAADAQAIVPALAATLEANYVFPDVARHYADALRAKLAAGGYSTFSDATAFAKGVTQDLQGVAKDGHLRVFTPTMVAKLRAGPPPGPGKRPDSFIEKSGWIAPGVAYISFLAFMGDKPTLAELRQFLASHANAKTLIIDARHHHGGGFDEMDLIFAQIFAKRTPLLAMDTRAAVAAREPQEFGQRETVKEISAPEGVVREMHSAIPAAKKTSLARAKVFLLTSSKTASAGEHLALALKRTHRATLIGETTRGAGNYGHPYPLPGGYAVFVPSGRTFDPATGLGWDGTGVRPDVEVPADNALETALKLSGVKGNAASALASLR